NVSGVRAGDFEARYQFDDLGRIVRAEGATTVAQDALRSLQPYSELLEKTQAVAAGNAARDLRMTNDAIRLTAGPGPDPRTFASGCPIGDVDVSPAGDDRYRITDPGGREVVFERDAFERLVSVQDALGRGHRVAYDEEGRIVTYGDTGGVEATFGYS